MEYEVALVGTGPDPENPNADGFAMAYRHAAAYQRLSNCRITACADIVRENAEAFAEAHGVDVSNVFEDSETMLRETEPDIVSVCVPPAVHAQVVTTCARSGVPDAVHCEKPMAKTWGECREMAHACEEAGVQLTFNHQRRFAGPFRRAKSLLEEGAVGPLTRIEMGGANLYDYGTHLFDLCGLFTDQATPQWVLAQIDYRTENVQFGVHNENQALVQWQYDNDVVGLASTGRDGMVSPELRLVGQYGVIEVGSPDGPALRYRTDGSGWQTVETGDGIHRPKSGRIRSLSVALAERLPLLPAAQLRKPTFIDRAIEDVVRALEKDHEPELGANNALQSTEVIFAAWESARRRSRVTLPLDIEDNPLEAMVEAGKTGVAAEYS
jgi:predicted dehydrogenase